MILHDKKILFVHIPRTGGSSIEEYFKWEGGPGWKDPDTAQHLTLEEYSWHYDLNDYFKFAFVRNPWDRLVSWFLWSQAENIYFNHISQTEDTKEIIVRSRFEAWNKGRDLLMNSQDSELKRKLFLEYKKGFTRFVEELRSSPLTYERRYDDISILENRLKGRWVLPQAKWLEAGTGSEIDYVGQFERLEKDFGCILKITKNKVSGLGHSGKIESKPDYKKFYTPKTQGIVRDIYAEDVEAFDYEF